MFKPKCLICNGCLMIFGFDNGTTVWYCKFCDKKYVKLPGGEVVKYVDNN